MFKVPVTTVKEVMNHPNAERLDIIRIYDWAVVAAKNQYRVGDPVVYIPIDSVLPEDLEKHLFPEGSKVKLHGSRVRATKIRGFVSQGLLMHPDSTKGTKLENVEVDLEQDVANILGITKYEPQFNEKGPSKTLPRNKVKENPFFHVYGGLNHIKWYADLFKEGDVVVVQEKLHGSNARCALLPYNADTWWRKLLQKFNLVPKNEFCYGSNRVQLQRKSSFNTTYYGFDLYGQTFKKYNIDKKVKLNEIWYGEIIGDGIQANYTYGCKKGEHRFVLFDVKIQPANGEESYWLLPDEVEALAKEREVEFVPVLYKGFYNKEQIQGLTKGPSVYEPTQPIREGIVIKSATERSHLLIGKYMLKWINDDYLLDKSNTDFH